MGRYAVVSKGRENSQSGDVEEGSFGMVCSEGVGAEEAATDPSHHPALALALILILGFRGVEAGSGGGIVAPDCKESD